MALKKRGAKRASAGAVGTPKKRGRPSKKEAEEKPEEMNKEILEECKEVDYTSTPSKISPSREQKSSNSEQKESEEAKVVERGHFYFFYRPKVDAQQVKGPDDIQRFYILMSPDGAVGKPPREDELEGKRGQMRQPHHDHQGKPLHRLLIIAGKSFPGQSNPRLWAFVDAVSSDILELENYLGRYSYDTKTRGHRDIQPARLIGEARYQIILHHDRHSHLVYELEFPPRPTNVQKAFHIYKEGQFLITVKNPVFNVPLRSDRWAGFKEGSKAEFPRHLMKHFRGKRLLLVRNGPLMTAEFLNVPHCELVLIGVKKNAKEEFEDLVKELEEEVEEDGKKGENEVYKELKASPREYPDAATQFE